MSLRVRRYRAIIVAAGVVVASAAATSPSMAAGKGSSSGTTCSRKSPCSSADQTPPTVGISTPSPGSNVSGTFTVSGTSSDNISVAKVDVQVDGGAFNIASGSTSWSTTIDSTPLTNGSHTITARATDGAGNIATAIVAVTTANGTSAADIVLANPNVGTNLIVTGRGRMTEIGTVSVLLYQESSTHKPWAYFRDRSSGATSHVALPTNQAPGNDWAKAEYAWSSAGDLWILSGGGPVHIRQYRLSGSPLPTTAALVSDKVLGDSDSRAGDLVVLRSGAIVGVWHQQGDTGSQGQGLAYRDASGNWSTTYPIQFMPTVASWQAAVQHPVDGSVWVFSDADSWGAIGAMHLTETTNGLALDWTNGSFVDVPKYGDHGPDPENPDIEAVPDPTTGTIALAYQSHKRVIFSTSPFVAGSFIAVARVAASGAVSFDSLATYVERVSQLGLVVNGGSTWLTYRPVDQSTLTYQDVYVSRFTQGAWGNAIRLGTTYSQYDTIAFGPEHNEFATRMADGAVHFFTASATSGG
ncbi:MAG: hypothetical protein JWO37_3074 [Acidimicrobiales bacterium]|jgi:hypothetical protein|nr:hypothetical protein [Acidimicrobiales bacterium]